MKEKMTFEEQIEKYEKLYSGVDIYSTPGTKIVYTGVGGYDFDREEANKVLTIGHTYTLKGSSVGNWSSFFFLDEVEGGFNSVMFCPEGWEPPKYG